MKRDICDLTGCCDGVRVWLCVCSYERLSRGARDERERKRRDEVFDW